jgi:DUF971 family protein
MIATQIKLPSKDLLNIHWDDGHESRITLLNLRDKCPCAACRGETILLKTYEPKPGMKSPGMYHLTNIQQVGHYAIQVFWEDGHNTGIYPWKLLRDLCECDNCINRNSK